MEDTREPVEKVSAWTEAERAPIPTQEEAFHAAQQERPALPPWAGTFFPGAIIAYAGWEGVIRFVGYENDRWVCLFEPTHQTKEPPIMSRSEYRRLKHQVGKKKVEEILKERKEGKQ